MLAHTAGVGFITPTLLMGGAERWVVDLIKALTPHTLISGIALLEGRTHPELLQELQPYCPIYHGIIGLETLTQNSRLLISWGIPEIATILTTIKNTNTLPLIIVSHGCGEARWMNRQADHAHHLIAVSERAIQGFEPDQQARVQIIENGVDPARLLPTKHAATTREEWGIPTDAPILLQVGRMTRGKNPELLIETIRALPDWYGVHIGWSLDEHYSALLRTHTQRRAPGRILWAKRTADVASAYHAATCLLMPSSSEAMSLAVLEALYVGLPVVTTAVGWFHAPDHDHLATVLTGPHLDGPIFAHAVLESPREHTRVHQARAHIHAHNTIQIMMKQWLEVLDRY